MRLLLILSTFVSGLLAGGNIDRAFVAMPAWQQVGAPSWAAFSRHADLGNGLVLYPVEAVGGALLTLAAAIMIHFDRNAPRAAIVSLYAAVLFAAPSDSCQSSTNMFVAQHQGLGTMS